MSQSLNSVILLIIRRVIPTIVANSIIGVQPMTGPAAQIFTLRTRYGYSSQHVYPATIWQINNYEYQFYGQAHDDIFDWLVDDCVWNYSIYTTFNEYFIKQKVTLIFDDIRGSIEFKVRF